MDFEKTVLRHIPHHPREKHDVYMCLPKNLNTIYIYIYVFYTSLDWEKKQRSFSEKRNKGFWETDWTNWEKKQSRGLPGTYIYMI